MERTKSRRHHCEEMNHHKSLKFFKKIDSTVQNPHNFFSAEYRQSYGPNVVTYKDHVHVENNSLHQKQQ